VKYEKRLGKTLVFLYISELGVQIFMKLWYLTLFLVLWCAAQSLGEWLGRCTIVYFSDMRSFSKIDFLDSLIVGLSSNLNI